MALVPSTYYALLEIFVFLAVAELLHSFARKIGLPNIVSDLLVGVVLSSFAVGGVLNALLGVPIFIVNDYVLLFADFSVILLLFAAGLGGGFGGLRSAGMTAVTAAIAGDLLPFFAVLEVFSRIYSLDVALLLAVAASGTSSAVVASLLQSEGVSGMPAGHFLMNVSALDDVVALLFLSVVLTIVGGESGVLAVTGGLVELVVAWVVLLLASVLVIPRVLRISHFRETRSLPFLFLFVLVALVVALDFSAIIGAYIAGIAVAESLVAERTREITEILLVLFGSLFFVVVGAQFDFRLFLDPVMVGFAVGLAALALVGKFVGIYAFARRRFGHSTSATIAIGTVPLGEIGLIVGAIGFSSGVLSQTQLGEILLMAIITTLIGSVLFRHRAPDLRPERSADPPGPAEGRRPGAAGESR